ncbi:MAG: hypothetical protein JXD21_04815 [Candidatus Omnitrophica bacterium]|nr:hypothetical protein [Candidatus Omnitrophota bacterium]
MRADDHYLFFLPWVDIQSKEMGMVSKLVSGKDPQGSLYAISGYDIPVMANSDESKLILMIARLFKPQVKDVDKKSFLIWLIPLSAIIIVLLRLGFQENKFFNIILGALGCLIFLIAAYKLNTTDLAKPALQVKIVIGVWLMLWAYFLIGITGCLEFVRIIKK